MPTNELPESARRIEFTDVAQPLDTDQENPAGGALGVKGGRQGTVHPDDLQGVPAEEVLENHTAETLRVKVDGKENYERYRAEDMRAL